MNRNGNCCCRQLDPTAMQSATFSQFNGALRPADLAKSKILDAMAAKYLVVDPGGLTGSYDPLPHGPTTSSCGTADSRRVACCRPGQLRGVSMFVSNAWLARDANAGETINVTVSAGGKTVSSGRFLGRRAGRHRLSRCDGGERLSRECAGHGHASAAPEFEPASRAVGRPRPRSTARRCGRPTTVSRWCSPTPVRSSISDSPRCRASGGRRRRSSLGR